MQVGRRLDEWDEGAIEHPLESLPEEGEGAYDNGDVVTTQNIGGTIHGLPSSVSFDMMSFADGSLSYLALHDIPFSQRIPLQPIPKALLRRWQAALPAVGDCRTDPAAQTEWYKNKLMQLMHEQGFVIHDASNSITGAHTHPQYN